MFTHAELEAKLTEFRQLPAETEWIEFKEARNGCNDSDLGEYFSALSNEANLKQQPHAWFILGVRDRLPRAIVGTNWHRGNRASLDGLKQRVADGSGCCVYRNS